VSWGPVGHRSVSSPTGSSEAVARLRLPQNVACGFPALRSSDVGSQKLRELAMPDRAETAVIARVLCYLFESGFHGRRFISLHRWP
jgi:hypothetical protein